MAITGLIPITTSGITIRGTTIGTIHTMITHGIEAMDTILNRGITTMCMTRGTIRIGTIKNVR